MKKIHTYAAKAETGKTPTQLSLCWSDENEENSYLRGPKRKPERPQHNLAYVGVTRMRKIHTYAAHSGNRTDPNTN